MKQFEERDYYPGQSVGAEFDPLLSSSSGEKRQRKKAMKWGLALGVSAICLALLLYLMFVLDRQNRVLPLVPAPVNLTYIYDTNDTLLQPPIIPGHEDWPVKNSTS